MTFFLLLELGFLSGGVRQYSTVGYSVQGLPDGQISLRFWSKSSRARALFGRKIACAKNLIS
jgi:hypothetical protein